MTSINLIVSGARAEAHPDGPLTEGAVGIRILCDFAEDWQELTPILFASCGTVTRPVYINSDNTADVPVECLIPGVRLLIGIRGLGSNGKTVVPTIWASAGTVRPSNGADDIPDPSPELMEQVVSAARNAEATARSLREDADNHRFDGAPGKAPKIGANGNWFVYDAQSQSWVDTGVKAEGAKGDKGDAYELTEADKNEIADDIARDIVEVSEEEPTNPRTAAWVDPNTVRVKVLTPEDLVPLEEAQQKMKKTQDDLRQDQQALRTDADELYDWTAAPVAPEATNPRADQVLRYNGEKIVLSSGYPGFGVYGYKLEGYAGRKISIDADSGGYLHVWTDHASTITGHIIGEAHDGDRIPDNALRLFVTAYSEKPPTVTVLTNGIAKLAEKQTDLEEAQKTLKEDLRDSEVGRVVSLSDAVSLSDGVVFETIGCPEYIDAAKRQQYARYNITEDGWYVFARVYARAGDAVSAGFSVTGAAGYIAPKNGDNYVDVAIKFNVIAETQRIVVNWGKRSESFVFKATDLATRNLDYRVTFYLYDIKDYATYEFGLATDEKFVKDKHYYTKQGDNYVEAEVTVDEAIPADTYYVHKKIIIAGYTRNVSYYCDLVDCPIELHLPTIYDDNYGAWFEIQFKADASYSVTIIPEGEAKVSGTGVNTPKVGINIINMQYHKPTQTWLPTVTNWAVSAAQPA